MSGEKYREINEGERSKSDKKKERKDDRLWKSATKKVGKKVRKGGLERKRGERKKKVGGIVGA